MRMYRFLLLVPILLLFGCKPVEQVDTTPPTVYYNDARVDDSFVLELEPSTQDIDLRDLFEVEDDLDSLASEDITISVYDLSKAGDYEINLSISDLSGNRTELIITLRILDVEAPQIQVAQLSFLEGSTIVDFEQGVSITDNVAVVAESIDDGSVNWLEPGEYTIMITASDAAGNETTRTYTITITKRPFEPVNPELDVDDGIIYYILESNIPGYYDYHIAAKAIQGVVNRNQPNLMIVDLNNPFYTHTDTVWKDYISEEGYEFIELTSFLEILTTFEHYFSDIIAINDNYKSYNGWVASDADFGAMISAVTYYMPVPEGALSMAIDNLEIELIDSFTLNDVLLSGYISDNFQQYDVNNAQEGYRFLFDNFKELFVTDKFMGLTSEAMDYAVQQRMMFFDLKPTYKDYDEELYTEICEWFDQQGDLFRLYGWVDQEGAGLNFIGQYGGLMNPVGSQNLSLYGVIPVDQTFEQSAEFVLEEYDPSKKYVTFLASEGDTFKAPMTFQQGSWLDPYRGMVPINWGLIASTVDEFPIIAKYMYDSMTSNDYFFSGGSSSVGYVDVDTQMPNGALAELVALNQYLLSISDQEYVDTYNDLFMFGDTFSPSFTGDYLIASGYTGAYGINPWESTGPIYMSDMLFYNRRNVFYPRRGSSSFVNLNSMTVINNNHYEQTQTSDYWYIQTELVRTTQDTATISFFTQANGDCYQVVVGNGIITLQKIVDGSTLELGSITRSSIGSNELIISVDFSSSMFDATQINVYFDKDRIFQLEDMSFFTGGFALESDAGVATTFQQLKGLHLSQSEEIYNKILSDTNQFIVGYYGVVFDHDFTLSQYHTEPGPGEVVSLSPTDFYKIALLLEENHPEEYVIVNMDEFYTYLLEEETN